MDWKNSNVLITGATGFVGTWLAKALIDRGANVIAFVRDEMPNAPIRTMEIVPKLHAIAPGDITDYASVKRVFDEYAIDTVFHLAAQAIVTVANASPIGTFDVNIRGTWNVLEAARTYGKVKRIVVASTDKVYGEPKELPITEDHPLLGSYPYDASKVALEAIARTYAVTYGMPVAITRCCNIYGGGDLNFSRIIPGAIKSVLEGTNPVIRSDGTPVRDFIHVDDAVAAYITLAEHIGQPGINGQAFNFGSTAPINMLDLTKKIIEASGRKQLKPDVQGVRKPDAEIDRQYLSAEKAAAVLGWKPKVKLEDGLKKTITWYEDYFSKIGKAE